jgi:hypothetical protein
MMQLGQCAPAVPGFTGFPKTYAAWPVWSGSTTAQVKFTPLPRKAAAKLYHRLRAFERQTRRPGRQDGAVTRNGLAIAHALLFDFLNFKTGQLDPAYEAIARAACISVRSVARGLQALKSAGVLHWIRRCGERKDENGRFWLEQESNAYAVLPPSQWRGYAARPEAPPPEPGTWGDHPCGTRGALTEALAEGPKASIMARVHQLENDPGDTLAAVLARLGRAIEGAPSAGFYWNASLTEKPS